MKTVLTDDGPLAMGESTGASGGEAMLAYHLGVEVECKVAEAINPRHYGEGFHSTGTCGPIGSGAAAAARNMAGNKVTPNSRQSLRCRMTIWLLSPVSACT